MTPREADKHVNDLIARGFFTVVRIRRDGGRVIRWPPEVDEWWEAVAVYCMARDADVVTEAHRQRVREAWRALDGRVEWSDDDRAFLLEVLSIH